MAEKKERLVYFDNVKALLIILVVIGHFIARLSSNENMLFIREAIYVFHMPAFLVLSGFFQRKRIEKWGALSSIQFGIAFVLQNALLYILMVMTETGSEYGLSAADYFSNLGLWAFWYMLALFFYGFVTGACKRKGVLVTVAIILYVILPFFKNVHAFNFSKIASFYIFFLIGYAGIHEKLLNFLRNRMVRVISAVVLCGIFYVLWKYNNEFVMGDLSLLKRYDQYETLAIGLLYRIGYLLVSLVITLCLVSVMTNRSTFATKMGTNSLYVFVLHNYVLSIFSYYDNEYRFVQKINSNPEYIVFLIACVVLTAILASDKCKKYFRWLVEPYSYLDMDKICSKLKSFMK